MSSDNGPLHLDCSGLTDLSTIIPQLSVLPNLTYLHLYQNKFKSLPSDISCLKHLETLDLSNTKFSSVDDVMEGLKSLPRLKHLFIRFEQLEDEERIAMELDNLASLNGISLEEPLDETEPTFSAIPQPLSPLLKQSKQDSPELLPLVLPSFSLSTSACDVLLQCPYLLEPASEENIDSKISTPVADNFELFLTLAQSDSISIDSTVKSNKALVEMSKLLLIKLRCISEDSENQSKFDSLLALCQLLVDTTAHNSDSLAVIGDYVTNLETIISRDHSSKSSLIDSSEIDKSQLKYMEEIGFLQQENERLLNRLKQLELKRISSPRTPGQNRGVNYSPNPNPETPEKSKGVKKVLTLKQLRDLIEEVYVSKEKFDLKCKEANLPRETMDQYLISFLTHKYGLKSLIKEWSRAVHVAVEKYQNVDNDVAVFDRMLKNEIDEEFRIVQSQLKSTVIELLKALIRTKFLLFLNLNYQIKFQEKSMKI
ncbi:hypothetical protein RCL1_004065 [Eukaryota sp. TZLM3-RCL]